MNRKSEEIKEKQISEVMASIENRVRHAYNQGYEQGLKASKQEGCTENPCLEKLCRYYLKPCEDCVSRDDVLDIIAHYHGQGDAFKELRDTQGVKPTERVGRWKKVVDRIDECGNRGWHHECSECGSQNSGWGEYNYCPDCGCRMNEDQESEDVE